jgi:hypothetical protein
MRATNRLEGTKTKASHSMARKSTCSVTNAEHVVDQSAMPAGKQEHLASLLAATLQYAIHGDVITGMQHTHALPLGEISLAA